MAAPQSFLRGFNLRADKACNLCQGINDDVQHIAVFCPRWEYFRNVLSRSLQCNLLVPFSCTTYSRINPHDSDVWSRNLMRGRGAGMI